MKKTIAFILLLISFHPGKTQQTESSIARYVSDFQPEKTWVHFDKAIYYPGETIWFKAYVMEGIFPAHASKTVYVDFIADNGTVLAHSVSPLVDGATNGQFDIPLEFTGNFVHVRAYTRWMLNFDTAFLFAHDIRILSPTAVKAKISRPATIPSLHFFPEGGDAILDVSNRIAFKAEDQWGRPVHFKGVVLDQNGKVMDSLQPRHDGMGYFSLQPSAGSSFTAKWKDEKGVMHTTPLPEARTSGIAMQVIADGARRIINLNASPALPENFRQLHLIGTTQVGQAFRTDVSMEPGGHARRIISVENLPSGILTVTLLDANWKAVAERICFINNHEFSFQPQMEVKHWGLSHRKRNELEFTVPDSIGAGTYSLSVTDASIERDTSENIVSSLMLSSEIRGRIFEPAYYFATGDDSREADLDLVMLTNGWRRFNWEAMAKGEMPAIKYPKDTAYLVFSGQLFGVARSQLSGKESIVLLTKEKDSSTHMMILPVNRDGSFADSTMILFDTLQVWYSLKSKFLANAEARFLTNRMPPPNYGTFSRNFAYSDPIYDTSGTAYHGRLAAKAAELLALEKRGMMENVTIKTTQRPAVEVMDDRYSTGMFKGGDGYKFDIVNDQSAMGYPNVLTYLQGKVAGLMVSTSGGNISLSWRDGQPQVYVDEMPTDIDVASNIPVSDVAYVKVFRPPFMGGFGGANGAIVIYTRKGGDARSTSTGLSSNKLVAYTPIRQFYSPNYDKIDPRNDHLDIRTTLYWNPLLTTTEKDHRIRVSFYSNDVSKSFRVVLEGMNAQGMLTHFEQIME